MVKRIIALVFIYFCASVAWMILGGTIFYRTENTNTALHERVVSSWGSRHDQAPPRASYVIVRRNAPDETVYLPLEKTRAEVKFDLEHRKKGLLWYAAYKVDFSGVYTFLNKSDRTRNVTFELVFPSEKAIYDDFVFELDGKPLEAEFGERNVTGEYWNKEAGAAARVRMESGATATLKVAYRSQGLDRWRYILGGLGNDVAHARDFSLKMSTPFKDIDFPEDTLSPTEKTETTDGWELAWNFKNLLSGFQIGMEMPKKLQPGPLAGKISLFAPISLLFFFFILFIITSIRKIDLHAMNYFFLAAAFFSFHLLMAYLVDQIFIHTAFLICSGVSIFLVVSYLRLVVGMRFAAVEAGLAQLVYLVLFSYAFFLKGFTGLTITIASILTLFVVMQMTGRIRWTEVFERASPVSARRPGDAPGDRA